MRRRVSAACLVLLTASAAADPPQWHRTVLHVHSLLSHDSHGGFAEIAAAARAAGVEAVLLTDHPGRGAPVGQPEGVLDGVRFIPGLELHGVLALGVNRPIAAASPQAAIAAIHGAGGLAIAAHPATYAHRNFAGLNGLEIYDVLDDVRDGFLPWTAARWAWRRWRDDRRTFAAILDYPRTGLSRWDALSSHAPLTAVGGVDAHQNTGLGSWRLDPYARQFLIVQTWVNAPHGDEASLLEALRRGRTCVVFALFGDPGTTNLTAGNSGGRAEIGGSLAWQPSTTLRFTVGQPGRARLLRDGTPFYTHDATQGETLTVRARGPGFYRAELWTLDESPPAPWVLTGGIRLIIP